MPHPDHLRPLQHDLDACLLAFGLGRANATDRGTLALGNYIAMERVGRDTRRDEDRHDWGATPAGTLRLSRLARTVAPELRVDLYTYVRNRCEALDLEFAEVAA